MINKKIKILLLIICIVIFSSCTNNEINSKISYENESYYETFPIRSDDLVFANTNGIYYSTFYSPNIYQYTKGEKDRVLLGISDFIPVGDKIFYTTPFLGNLKEYRISDSSKCTIADDVQHFEIFEEKIYYLDAKNKLYVYVNGTSKQIADNIDSFCISNSGAIVCFVAENRECYYALIDEATGTKQKLNEVTDKDIYIFGASENYIVVRSAQYRLVTININTGKRQSVPISNDFFDVAIDKNDIIYVTSGKLDTDKDEYVVADSNCGVIKVDLATREMKTLYNNYVDYYLNVVDDKWIYLVKERYIDNFGVLKDGEDVLRISKDGTAIEKIVSKKQK